MKILTLDNSDYVFAAVYADALFIVQSTIVLTGHAAIGREELLTGNTVSFWSVNLAVGVRF